MESFFLSETLKYLFLIFDEDSFLFKDNPPFIWTTEGHPFPNDAGRTVDTTPWNGQCNGFSNIMRGPAVSISNGSKGATWELSWPFKGHGDSLPMHCPIGSTWDPGPVFDRDFLNY